MGWCAPARTIKRSRRSLRSANREEMANKFDILVLLWRLFFGDTVETLPVLSSRFVQFQDPPNDRRIVNKRLYRHEHPCSLALGVCVAVLFQEGIFQISIPTDIRLRYMSKQLFDLVPQMSRSPHFPLLLLLLSLFLIRIHLLVYGFGVIILPFLLHIIQIFGIFSSPMNSPSVGGCAPPHEPPK
jgi:hypothetical protein